MFIWGINCSFIEQTLWYADEDTREVDTLRVVYKQNIAYNPGVEKALSRTHRTVSL